MRDLAESLEQSGHFDALTSEEIATLCQALAVLEVKDGQVLIREGEMGHSLHVILDGRVRVTQQKADGTQADLGEMETGELYGLVSLIDHGPRTATVTAVGPARVGILNQLAFTLLHEGSPELALHFQTLVAQQLARDSRALNEALVAAMLAPAQEPGQQAKPLSNDLKLS